MIFILLLPPSSPPPLATVAMDVKDGAATAATAAAFSIPLAVAAAVG